MPFRSRAWEICAIALIALNLRPFLAGPGQVLDRIGAQSGLDTIWLSLLTLAPLALIGLGALAAPLINDRVGIRPTILTALALIAAGNALRLLPLGEIVIGTAAICGAGVALLQAVMPALIQDRFPSRYGAVTAIYSASLLIGGALGAQTVAMIAARVGWPAGLAAMAVPALFALTVTHAVTSLDMRHAPDRGGRSEAS